MNKYDGGDFDDFLKEEGIFEEVLECTRKRLLAARIEDHIKASSRKGITLVYKTNADLVQLNHYLFDIDNTVITSELLDGLTLEATEMRTKPLQLNDSLFDSKELLDCLLTDEIAA